MSRSKASLARQLHEIAGFMKAAPLCGDFCFSTPPTIKDHFRRQTFFLCSLTPLPYSISCCVLQVCFGGLGMALSLPALMLPEPRVAAATVVSPIRLPWMALLS